MQQWGKGQKEREVLGTSSQWVALSGHCPSATVSNVKGGEIGDGVAEHVLILKDCHQTNPVEGRTTTTISKPTREGTEPSPPSLHISYSFIHSFIHLFIYSLTFHSPPHPTPPMWLPRGTITTWHVPYCHSIQNPASIPPNSGFCSCCTKNSTATNHTNHHPFFYIKESRHHLMLPYHSIIGHQISHLLS